MSQDLSLSSPLVRGAAASFAEVATKAESSAPTLHTTNVGNFSEFLSQFSSEQLQQKFGPCLDKLRALKDQHDPLLLAKELFNIGCELADRGMTEGAVAVFSTLVGTIHELSLQRPVFQDIQARAQERLNALQSTGAILPRVELLAKQMPKEIFNLSGFSAMAAAMPTFRFTTAVAKAMLGTGIGPWLAANTVGFLAESAMFTTVGRGVRELIDGRGDSLQRTGTARIARTSWGMEWVHGMPMLLGLKGFGGLAGLAGEALLARGYGYTALQSFSLWGMHQAAMLNGIMFGNRVSDSTQGISRDFWMSLAEAGVTAVHFNAVGPMLGAVANPHEALRRDVAETQRRFKETFNPQLVTPEGIKILQSEIHDPNSEKGPKVLASSMEGDNRANGSNGSLAGMGLENGLIGAMLPEHQVVETWRQRVKSEPELGEVLKTLDPKQVEQYAQLAEKGAFRCFEYLALLADFSNVEALRIKERFIRNGLIDSHLQLSSPRINLLIAQRDPEIIRQLHCFAKVYQSKEAQALIKKFELSEPLQNESPSVVKPAEAVPPAIAAKASTASEPLPPAPTSEPSPIPVGTNGNGKSEPKVPAEKTSLKEKVLRRMNAAIGTVGKVVVKNGDGQSFDRWEVDFLIDRYALDIYGLTTHHPLYEKRIVPDGLLFAKSFPALVAAMQEAILATEIPAVIHAKESLTYLRPIRAMESLRARVTAKQAGGKGRPTIITLKKEILSGKEIVATGETKIVINDGAKKSDGAKKTSHKLVKPEELPKPRLKLTVTPQMIDDFSKASKDYNPVHTSDAEAKELGLEGRILHGMATYNFAERALYGAQNLEGSMRPHNLETTFHGMARPGDVLLASVKLEEDGSGTVVVFNQRNNDLILTLEQKFLDTPPSNNSSSTEPKAPVQVPVPPVVQPVEPQLISNTYGGTTVEVNASGGYNTVLRARDNMAPHVSGLRQALGERVQQPWVIAGVSDGMGLASAIAAIEAGVRTVVGVFYEPETLLEKKSPVHLGRLANVEGLRIFAKEKGAQFYPIFADAVLPQWGKGTRELPEEVRKTIEMVRNPDQSSNPDIIFINSIAFARWICPSPGVQQLKDIPSIDIEGRVVLMPMKPYQEKNYQGTLDSMGRNHGALLEALKPYLGPRSASFFFTWAGGSQNRRVLRGVYGDGVLGDAKEIGETDTIRFHLQSQDAGFKLGHHKIIRFPDFPSFAIFGIPGGGVFAMIARQVLESHGSYKGISDLAPLAFIEAFGGEHNLRNPAAQIELDIAESYHLKEIQAKLAEFHHRVAKYRQDHPDWDGKALPLDVSRELLRSLVSEDYVNQIPKATE